MNKVDVKIFDQKNGAEIDEKIFGHFIEKLFRCIDGGILFKEKLNLNALKTIKQIKPSIIRYPGGCFADTYHWKEEIGPLKDRKKIFSIMWNQEEENIFGTNEYLEFCKLLNAEPYITVNVGSGTSEEAAEWVKYCNELSKKDFPKVRYWSLGNEIWGKWEIGHLNSKQYISKVKDFVSKMKSVDPEIKITIAGSRKEDTPNWNKEILSEVGELVDYLSLHVFPPSTWPETDDEINRSLPSCYYGIVSSIMYVEELLRNEENTLNSLGLKNKIALSIDEFNVWYPGYGPYKNNFEIDYSIEQAIFFASFFHFIFRKSDLIKIACPALLTNVMGLIKVNYKNQITLSPGYFVYDIYANHSGKYNLKTEYNNYFYNSNPFVDMPAYKNVPILDIASTTDEKNRKLFIHIINRDLEKSYELNIKFLFKDKMEFKNIIKRTISCNDFREINFPNINNIGISEENIYLENLINLIIGPHSIVNIEIDS